MVQHNLDGFHSRVWMDARPVVFVDSQGDQSVTEAMTRHTQSTTPAQITRGLCFVSSLLRAVGQQCADAFGVLSAQPRSGLHNGPYHFVGARPFQASDHDSARAGEPSGVLCGTPRGVGLLRPPRLRGVVHSGHFWYLETAGDSRASGTGNLARDNVKPIALESRTATVKGMRRFNGAQIQRARSSVELRAAARPSR